MTDEIKKAGNGGAVGDLVHHLVESDVQSKEIRSLLAVHARRDLSTNVGAKQYMVLYEDILVRIHSPLNIAFLCFILFIVPTF